MVAVAFYTLGTLGAVVVAWMIRSIVKELRGAGDKLCWGR